MVHADCSNVEWADWAAQRLLGQMLRQAGQSFGAAFVLLAAVGSYCYLVDYCAATVQMSIGCLKRYSLDLYPYYQLSLKPKGQSKVSVWFSWTNLNVNKSKVVKFKPYHELSHRSGWPDHK